MLCCGSRGTSIGAVSISEVVELDVKFLRLLRLGVDLRRLLCRRNCAVAATTAREGGTPLRIEAAEDERNISRPSRFSTGGSNLAAFAFRSSRLSKTNDDCRLGTLSLAIDSPSLESLSNSAGYRSRIDALRPIDFVSVRAMPFSSTVNITDARCRCLPSDIDPCDDRPIRLTGEDVRAI